MIKERKHPHGHNSLDTYKDLRRELGDGMYMSDLDAIEYRIVDGQPQIRAVMEFTGIDNDSIPGTALLKAIEARSQVKLALHRLIAHRLDCRAIFVIHSADFHDFWTWDMMTLEDFYDIKNWKYYDRDKFFRAVKML